MLEFYEKYYPKSFAKKADKLSEELLNLLKVEGISIKRSDKQHINSSYQKKLGIDLYNKLNDLYGAIRESKPRQKDLLRKYLPETKIEPENSQILFADFFSGAGGLSQGLINAGFTPAFVNDNFTDALETYYFNHNLILDRFYNGDIKELVENADKYKKYFKRIKIIAGGPPCQGFSSANRQNYKIDPLTEEKHFIEDKRNILYKYFIKMISIIQPDFFIIENVRGMMKVEQQIEKYIKKETNQEYHFVPLVLDAQAFGVPQSRIRYILIGGKDFMFLEQIKQSILRKSKSKSRYYLKDALYGLPIITTNPKKLNPDYDSIQHGYTIRKKAVKQNVFLKDINRNIKSEYILNHKSRYNNENDLEIFRILPEGANSLHESIKHLNNYKNRDHIFHDKYYKLRLNEVSKTITSHMRIDCHMYIHPTQSRGISPREAARIQTFSDNYFFRGSLNSWYQQIGNAVPVKLSETIAKQIMKYYK